MNKYYIIKLHRAWFSLKPPVLCTYGLVMFIFEKNPKNLQKPSNIPSLTALARHPARAVWSAVCSIGADMRSATSLSLSTFLYGESLPVSQVRPKSSESRMVLRIVEMILCLPLAFLYINTHSFHKTNST